MAISICYSSLAPSPHLPIPHSYTRNLRAINCVSVNHSNKEVGGELPSSSFAGRENLRVIFAAGGTGNHIYPAVAIADELKMLDPNVQILFVGTSDGMEAKAVPLAGYPFAAIPAVPLYRPLLSASNLFVLPYILTNCTFKSCKIIREFDPHVVVGTGGFVSFPTCLAAAFRRIKLVIQEQNSVPGIANSVLALLADRIFVAFNSSVECFWKPVRYKCEVCGNPVRSSLIKNVPKKVALQRFFPKVMLNEGEGKVVLVLGGSLGANTINIALLNSYYQMLNECEELFIIWQTGVEAYSGMRSLVRKHPRVFLAPFLHALDMAYAASDLIVSRAGAMTCYEILATGKPCILIPSPNADEGHQYKNASLMAKLACSRVIHEDELDSAHLKSAIQETLEKEHLMAGMSKRASEIAKTDAASEIAQQILSLVNLSAAKE